METLLKLNVFVCFLFSVGSEVSGSWGTVIVNQNFYFSNDDWWKLLRTRVRQLDLFVNCEITGEISVTLNLFRIIFWCSSTAGESRVSGVRLASLSRGRHDTARARPSQTTRHKSTISPKYTKRKPKTHAEISEANSNIYRCVSLTILSEFRCVSHLHKSRNRTGYLLTSA